MEYCDKIDICVRVLKGYLQRIPEPFRQEQIKNLFQEKEGWVETQFTRWAAHDIKEYYKFDVWDADFYFSIDVMAILISQLSSQRVAVS